MKPNVWESRTNILIQDLGVNIGLSAPYFRLIYPDFKIVLVEQSSRNIELAIRNTALTEFEYMIGAIADKEMRSTLVDLGEVSDGFRVEESIDGKLTTFTVNGLLEKYSQFLFIVKIDIEGYESQLFISKKE